MMQTTKPGSKQILTQAGMALRFARSANVAALVLAGTLTLSAQTAKDPGVRGGAPGAGGFQTQITDLEKLSEPSGTAQFAQAAQVTGGPVTGNGLGPRFSGTSCAMCHAQPAAGGSSPKSNPVLALATQNGAQNTVPNFETASGPILIPRFAYNINNTSIPDGLEHPLWVVTGRTDATGCSIQQPNFTLAASQNNLFFRQPLPVFGDGFIEIIQNSDILNNMNSNLALKQSLGIIGAVNITDDGSIGRLGWKAQWRALLPASGAEEQGELGITNEMFPTEMDQTTGCLLNPVPEDPTNYTWVDSSNTPWSFLANAERDADFIRFLAQPVKGKCSAAQSSCNNGQVQFNNIGCVLCHTASYLTPAGSIPSMGHIPTPLDSDLLIHHMGPCLADNIVQGNALGDMFRTPPLWNVGQRIWFMHDGRTSDIVQAIEDHSDVGKGCANPLGYQASEADAVVAAFNALSSTNQQDLVNWLRSL